MIDTEVLSGILGFDACFPDSVVGFIPSPLFPSAKYFEYFLRTAKADLLEFAPATAQKNIHLEILSSLRIPIPPLAEQARIVTMIDGLMALCDELEARIASDAEVSHELLEAVLSKAVGINEVSEGSGFDVDRKTYKLCTEEGKLHERTI